MTPPRRFSDQQLQEFYEEFVDHSEREHLIQESFTQAIQENNRLVMEIQKENRQIREDTQGLLQAWNTLIGGKRFLGVSGKFVMWLGGVVGALGVIWYAITHGFPQK